MLETIETLRGIAQRKRGLDDAWGPEILLRLSGESDLVAAEGMYHLNK